MPVGLVVFLAEPAAELLRSYRTARTSYCFRIPSDESSQRAHSCMLEKQRYSSRVRRAFLYDTGNVVVFMFYTPQGGGITSTGNHRLQPDEKRRLDAVGKFATSWGETDTTQCRGTGTRDTATAVARFGSLAGLMTMFVRQCFPVYSVTGARL